MKMMHAWSDRDRKCSGQRPSAAGSCRFQKRLEVYLVTDVLYDSSRYSYR